MDACCRRRLVTLSCGCLTSLGFFIFIVCLTFTSETFRPMGITLIMLFTFLSLASLATSCVRMRAPPFPRHAPSNLPMQSLSLEEIEMLHVYEFDSALKSKPVGAGDVAVSPLHTISLQSQPSVQYNPFVQNGDLANQHSTHISEFDHTYPLGCCICLCDYADREVILELPCRHCYHRDCIVQWLVKSALCPVCKANVLLALMGDNEPAPQILEATGHPQTGHPAQEVEVPDIILPSEGSNSLEMIMMAAARDAHYPVVLPSPPHTQRIAMSPSQLRLQAALQLVDGWTAATAVQQSRDIPVQHSGGSTTAAARLSPAVYSAGMNVYIDNSMV